MSGAPQTPPSAFRAGTPVGTGGYVVRAGDCLQSIAHRHGHVWKTIWNAPGNKALREARGDAMVILPRDRLEIPEIREGVQSCATEARHRFRRKGTPAVLKIRMLRDGKPRADEPWTLETDDATKSGRTDGDGRIRVAIPPHAHSAILRVGDGEDQTVQRIKLGRLAPFDTVLGTQQRLNNLGLYHGPENGRWSERLAAAIDRFRALHELPAEDRLSRGTLDAIRDAYGA